MARGIEKGRIFRDDVDRRTFVARLDDVCVAGEAAIYAWCLLPNHFHLLMRTGATPLSTLMRRLLTAHAVGFNRRHDRVGHLLQNRFKSIVVEEEPYFIELVRYIHLNAVRAGLVRGGGELARYPWAGHAAILGAARLRAHDVECVLRHFAGRAGAARQAYLEFVAAGLRQGRRPELTGGGLRRSLRCWQVLPNLDRGREKWTCDERVLGSSDFVLSLLRAVPPPPLPSRDVGAVLSMAIDQVASRSGVAAALIRSNSRLPAAVAARAQVCAIGVRRGLAVSAVATYLGISRRTVVRGLRRAGLGT